MQVVKKDTYYLLKNDQGEYHLDATEYEKLGKDKAVELAETEIAKKVKLGQYQDLEIDFSRARDLGFCEYGIKDFCKQLDLDTTKTYKVSELMGKLTVEVLLTYPDEIMKLFGKQVFDKFGGAKKLLEENRTREVMNLVIEHVIVDEVNHLLAVKFARRCLVNFEKEYPNDDRPRKAIEAKERFIKGEIGEAELSAAWSAARSAESAAWSAARSAAESAARSAAWSAARSAESAAWSAAWSAARSAAWSARSAAWSAAELEWQVVQVLERL